MHTVRDLSPSLTHKFIPYLAPNLTEERFCVSIIEIGATVQNGHFDHHWIRSGKPYPYSGNRLVVRGVGIPPQRNGAVGMLTVDELHRAVTPNALRVKSPIY